jgi:hypothetical protein
VRSWIASLIAGGSVVWAVWVGELTDRLWLTLLPVIWLILAIGDERFGGWTIAGLALFAVVGTMVGIASGATGAGVPLLVGAVPWLMAWPMARAGGRYAERRRERV